MLLKIIAQLLHVLSIEFIFNSSKFNYEDVLLKVTYLKLCPMRHTVLLLPAAVAGTTHNTFCLCYYRNNELLNLAFS